jgi:hypothetical protein
MVLVQSRDLDRNFVGALRGIGFVGSARVAGKHALRGGLRLDAQGREPRRLGGHILPRRFERRA